MAKIVLTGGGTAGHCIPNLTLIPHLKKHFNEIHYIGSVNGMEKSLVKNYKIPYHAVSCEKLRRSLTVKNFSIPIKLIKGVTEAGKILDEIKPDVIFSKGGYVSVPAVIAGKKRKIPIVLHESDLTMGLANKLCAKFSNLVLTSFPETAKSVKNGVYVGSPIRKIKKTKTDISKFGFNLKKPVLLVFGGSQGAYVINETLRNALPDLLEKFNVFHICGKGNINKKIEKNGYYQVEFVNNMDEILNLSDVCVTRAGANSLFELTSIKKPCLVIPLPKGNSRGDQVLNAEYFEKKGQILVLPQSSLTEDSLKFYVNALYGNKDFIKSKMQDDYVSDKSEKIAEILSGYIKNK